jgi:hypothetical protein
MTMNHSAAFLDNNKNYLEPKKYLYSNGMEY